MRAGNITVSAELTEVSEVSTASDPLWRCKSLTSHLFIWFNRQCCETKRSYKWNHYYSERFKLWTLGAHTALSACYKSARPAPDYHLAKLRMRGEIVFLLTALCASCGSAQLHYTPSGSCEVGWSETLVENSLLHVMPCFSLQTTVQSEHTCEYLYSVEQSRFTGNAEDSITVTANIQVWYRRYVVRSSTVANIRLLTSHLLFTDALLW